MMQNDSGRHKTVVLSGAAALAVSILLFIAAVAIGDFGQPGQFSVGNRSAILLLASFVLLCGLAIALLIVVSRAEKSPAPASRRTSPRAKGTETAAEAGEAVPSAQDGTGQLLSDTAGELRTSVDAIQEELEDMMDDEDAADKERVQSLVEETDRLKKIIDGMEQFSQAQAHARSLRREALELVPLLNSVLEKARTSPEGSGVSFSLTCDPGLVVTADRECLGRILANLLDNAVKAVKHTGTVTVTAARKGDDIVLSVEDTGTGIRPKHLPHIYERFFRGTGMGIGMGLTIVKELVDASGATIEVQTMPGKGTVFTVHVPAS